MRILLVGPTGALGHALMTRLAEAGHTLVICARRPERLKVPEGADATVVEADVGARSALLEAARGCDAAHHLVAWAGDDFVIPERRLDQLYAINVAGTRTVAEACAEAGVGRLVYTSTHLAAGPLSPEALTPYVVSRRLAEGEVWKVGARGMHVEVLAPAFTIGDDGPLTRLLIDLADARIPVFPEGTRVPVVPLADVVEAHLAALERGEAGARYLLQADALGWRALGDLVGLATGWPVVMRAAPPHTVEVAGRVDALVSRLRRRDPVGRRERILAFTHAATGDPSLAERALRLHYSDARGALAAHLDALVAAHRIGGE